MRSLFYLLILMLVYGCELNEPKPFYYDLNPTPPDDYPSVFARGILSTHHHEHSAPAISPDGTEIYWSRWERPAPANPIQKIYCIKYLKSGWGDPKVASFSGMYTEGGPFFSPDGQRLFYYSKRPVVQDSSAKGDNDIWYVERDNKKWLEPKRMDAIINNERIQALPSVSNNKNLYFLNYHNNVEHNFGIYKSVFQSDKYSEPLPLPKQINSVYRDWTPFISPKEDFIIFSSHRPNGYGSGDLYISFIEKDGNWSEAVNLGETINTPSQERFPMVSPDGEILFFTRSTDSYYDDIYWVKSSIISRLKK